MDKEHERLRLSKCEFVLGVSTAGIAANCIGRILSARHVDHVRLARNFGCYRYKGSILYRPSFDTQTNMNSLETLSVIWLSSDLVATKYQKRYSEALGLDIRLKRRGAPAHILSGPPSNP